METRCDIYVEEYVLSYLRREGDSLELSEIYFYGQREDGGAKIYVYGAGREKGIAVFAKYEPLTELVCRLTQAGPVFMLRGADGSCRATGFQVFYENNEAMQSYLIEWTGSGNKGMTVGDGPAEEKAGLLRTATTDQMKRHVSHGAISAQLCLLLLVLVAVVISSTDSYDKMEQLGQSAKEVFFAIENQEADEESADTGKQSEIVVERIAEEEEPDGKEESGANEEDSDKKRTETEDSGTEEEPVERTLEPVKDKPEEMQGEDTAEKEEESGKGEEEEKKEEKEDKPEEEKEEQPQEEATVETAAEDGGEDREALSRKITRYYEVEQGDTLYTISQEIYGDISRVGKICEVNQISDPDKIRSGQKIILP